VLNVLSSCIAALAQLKTRAKKTFMRIVRNIMQTAAGTVKFNFNFIVLLLGVYLLFGLQLLHEGGRKLSPAHWTVHC
jgi:hypothetical protein